MGCRMISGRASPEREESQAVVKGSPVLNDVTMDDACQSRLTELCEVVDNGSGAIGTLL